MVRNPRMKCSSCGHWNRIPVNKISIEQTSPEPEVKVFIPIYEPSEVSCEKELTRITEGMLANERLPILSEDGVHNK